MKLNLGLEPNPKQKLFLLENEHKYIGFGGSRGGGKSWAVRTKAILLSYKYPGIKLTIVRKTYDELKQNHIAPMTEILKCYADSSHRFARYNDTEKQISFPNGSTIRFRYCENEKDAERFQGQEADCLFIDEATQYPEIIFDKLKAIVRGVNQFPKRIYLTCNPGGVGHQWVKRLFLDKQFKPTEKPEEYIFIRSSVRDNYALMQYDPDYIHQLEALPAKLRKAWLDGDWDIFEGQFFEDFITVPMREKCIELGLDDETLKRRRQWTHVIPDFEDIPSAWKIYRSFDWGYSKPFSCGYWAVDYDGVIYRITEFYGCTGEPNEGVKWNPDKVFEELKKFEDTHPLLAGKHIDGVADPAIWDAQRGESIARMAVAHGISFVPGDNKRIPGWMQIHYRLAFDHNGYARMYICEGCRHFIRTLPLLQYDETHIEDLDTDGEDHIADETRYMCMTRPVKPIIEVVKEYKINPLEM